MMHLKENLPAEGYAAITEHNNIARRCAALLQQRARLPTLSAANAACHHCCLPLPPAFPLTRLSASASLPPFSAGFLAHINRTAHYSAATRTACASAVRL